MARVGLLVGGGDGVGGVGTHLGGEPDVRVVAFLDAGGFGGGDQRGLGRLGGLGGPRVVIGAVDYGYLGGAELGDILAGGLVIVRLDVGLGHDVGDFDVAAAEVFGHGTPLVDGGDDLDLAGRRGAAGIGLAAGGVAGTAGGHREQGRRGGRDGERALGVGHDGHDWVFLSN